MQEESPGRLCALLRVRRLRILGAVWVGQRVSRHPAVYNLKEVLRNAAPAGEHRLILYLEQTLPRCEYMQQHKRRRLRTLVRARWVLRGYGALPGISFDTLNTKAVYAR